MDDLIAFFSARLDEVEAAAAAASDGPWTPWRGKPAELGLRFLKYGVMLPSDMEGSPALIATASWMDAEHIALNDPVAVLADVAADRALLAAYEQAGAVARFPDHEGGYATGMEDAIRIRAARFALHPEYREDWN